MNGDEGGIRTHGTLARSPVLINIYIYTYEAKRLNNYLDSKIRYLFLQETKSPISSLTPCQKKVVVLVVVQDIFL